MSNSDYTLEAGWAPLRKLVEEECRQAVEEGKDPAAVEALRQELAATPEERAALEALYQRLVALPVRPGFPFHEPSGLAEIISLREEAAALPDPADIDPSRLEDQLHGAWLGRCVGCALGKPVEEMMLGCEGMPSWQRLKAYLTSHSPTLWPLGDYIPASLPGAPAPLRTICPASTREAIAFMESDDDIRYTVLGQILLEKHGAGFGTHHVAQGWLEHLPYRMVATAETQAYRNIVSLGAFRLENGEAIDWEALATRLNPYREWIGAQIRVDSYGYAAAGQPDLAAEWAWRDARLSHTKNGIYGAMFCAAMIAAAFVTPEPRQIVEAGLARIPQTSRLYRELRQVIALCDSHGCAFEAFEAVLTGVHALLGHYPPVHTNNNAALCVAALLLSGGDFHRGITLAVMGGWDTDCNGATVGSIVGAICGAKRAPAFWTGRLQDTLQAAIIGYHPVAISECARRAAQIARRIAR